MEKNREKYFRIIDDFINHPSSKILLLKGKWGVGKTYFWKNYLKQKLRKFQYRAYSYVSLFGLDTLANIKEEIFGNADILKEWKTLKNIGNINKLSSFVKKVPLIKDYNGIITHFENSFIKNFLICFDDIERKSKKLSLSTFLGFCNQLKEENGCKIIIIMNEDEIEQNKDDKSDLLKYREKVIDQELLFQPTLKDNYYLIFNSSKYDYALNFIEKYNISNLRILQKIKWNLDFFESYLKDLEPSVKIYFNRQIISLSFFILSSELSTEFSEIATKVNDYSNKDLVNRKSSFYSNYNYYFEPKDEVFINYIKNLHLDVGALQEYLDEVNEKEKKSKIKSKIEKIWDGYSSNFLLTPEEFSSQFVNILDNYLEFLSLRDLESILDALKKLEPNFEIDKYWEKFVEININHSNIDTLTKFKARVSNPDLFKRIEKKYTEEISNFSVKEIIYHITEKNSWNHNHIMKLLQAEEKEYYDWFLTENDSNILFSLRSFLQTFNPSSDNEEYRIIGNKIVEVLNKVAKIDKLKELRVREFFDIKENVKKD